MLSIILVQCALLQCFQALSLQTVHVKWNATLSVYGNSTFTATEGSNVSVSEDSTFRATEDSTVTASANSTSNRSEWSDNEWHSETRSGWAAGEMMWHPDSSVGKNQMWYDVHMSADGVQRAAVVIGGHIWSSVDAGMTWTEDTSIGATKLWRAIRMSRDGEKRIAVEASGEIWRSVDYGATWQKVYRMTSKLLGVAMSAHGVHVIVAAYGHGILISEDSGDTWNMSAAPKGLTWRTVAMSKNGTYQLAAVNGGSIYRSSDHGKTWMECVTEDAGSSEDTGDGWVEYAPRWVSVSISADGQNMAAVPIAGRIWRSPNWGQTWIRDETQGEREWAAVQMSFSGQNRIAAVSGGNIFLSVDYGVTWIEENNVASSPEDGLMWYAVAMSGNGSDYAGAVMQGTLWKRVLRDDEMEFLQQSAQGDHGKMKDWVITWINHHGGLVTNFGDLNAVVEFYSGVADRKSFKQLLDELQTASWIEGLTVFYEKPAAIMQEGMWRDEDKLEEFSFGLAANNSDPWELVDWVQYWISNHGGTVTDLDEFGSLLAFYNGEKGKKTFLDLKEDLKAASWIENLQDEVVVPVREPPSDEDMFTEIVNQGDRQDVVDWVRFWIKAHGGTVTNEGDLAALVEFYNGEQDRKDFVALVEELKAAPWVEGLSMDKWALDVVSFQQVVKTGDHDAVVNWVHSWIENHGGRVANEGDLSALVEFYSGRQDTKSLVELVNELRKAAWAEGLNGPAHKPVAMSKDEEYFLQVVNTGVHEAVVNWVQSWIETHGGTVTNEGDLSALVEFYSGRQDRKSFPDLVEELKAAAWIDGFHLDDTQPVAAPEDEESFTQAVNAGDHDAVVNWVHSWIDRHGGSVTNEGDLSAVVEFYSGRQDRKSFPELVEELKTAAWIQGWENFRVARPGAMIFEQKMPIDEKTDAEVDKAEESATHKGVTAEDEQGFEQVVIAGDHDAAVNWVYSWVGKHGGNVTNEGDLSALVEFYSGKKIRRPKGFQALVQELKGADWIEGLDLEATSPGAMFVEKASNVDRKKDDEVVNDAEWFAQVVSTGDHDAVLNWARTWIDNHGGTVINDGDLNAFVDSFHGAQDKKSFAEFVSDLKAVSWVTGLKVDDEKTVAADEHHLEQAVVGEGEQQEKQEPVPQTHGGEQQDKQEQVLQADSVEHDKQEQAPQADSSEQEDKREQAPQVDSGEQDKQGQAPQADSGEQEDKQEQALRDVQEEHSAESVAETNVADDANISVEEVK